MERHATGTGGGIAPVAPPRPWIAVVGATASGKSALAIELAERFGGEIVGTDSLQVYRGLDIGTAKPTLAERARMPHHLIDVAAPDESYSAGRYTGDARAVISRLERAGRVPVLCGGTGLYFKALLRGLTPIPAIPDALRQAVAERTEREGLAAAYAALEKADPVSAARIHPHDTARILRALEVFEATGEPLSAFRQRATFGGMPPHVLSVGIQWERATLYERIGRRVQRMLAAGWVAEVRELLAQGYGPELKPLRSIGYREVVEHLQGRRAESELAPAIATRTRHYAKRQLTWFRGQPDIFWAEPGQESGVVAKVEAFLERTG